MRNILWKGGGFRIRFARIKVKKYNFKQIMCKLSQMSVTNYQSIPLQTRRIIETEFENLHASPLIQYGDILSSQLPKQYRMMNLAEKCYLRAVELTELKKGHSKAHHRIGLFYLKFGAEVMFFRIILFSTLPRYKAD